MFDESSEPGITFRLTAENRDLIVNHAVAVNDELTKKLRMGVVEGKRLSFTFQLHELVDLVDALASEGGHASPRHLRRRFSRIYDELARRLDAVLASPQGLDSVPLVDPRSEFRREVQEVLESESFANLDEVNKRLQALSKAHNRRPMPDHGGLSPLQVSRLIHGDWEGQKATVVL